LELQRTAILAHARLPCPGRPTSGRISDRVRKIRQSLPSRLRPFLLRHRR